MTSEQVESFDTYVFWLWCTKKIDVSDTYNNVDDVIKDLWSELEDFKWSDACDTVISSGNDSKKQAYV